MALSNNATQTGRFIAPYAIAEKAWKRLYDSFPMTYVSRATGPRGFKITTTAAASNGATFVPTAEGQSTATNFDPTFTQTAVDLTSYRARVTVSNELAQDSTMVDFIANRLAGQLIESVGVKIVQTIAASLINANRYTAHHHFDVGAVGLTGAAKIEDHSGFHCLSNLTNPYRQRACWVFSPTGFLNYGTQEGRGNLVTLGVRQEDYLYGRLIGEASATSTQQISPLAGGGGGGGGKGGEGEGELSKQLDLQLRSRLTARSPLNDSWHTAYLGCPVHTSTGLGVTHNQEDAAWAMLVDLSQYVLFDQPLSVYLDTESLIANNQTIVHAVYRNAGELMDPQAGWALVSPSV